LPLFGYFFSLKTIYLSISMMFLLLTLLAPLHASTTQPSFAPTTPSVSPTAPAGGPRAFPDYPKWDDGYLPLTRDNVFYEWTSSMTFEECVAECEYKGTACWGFQTMNGWCDYIITRDPGNAEPLIYSNFESAIYKKATQTWDEELKRCMGLTWHSSLGTSEECQHACAHDDSCDLYQWYWSANRGESGVGECYMGKSWDCNEKHFLEGFEVVEGYRKQVIDWMDSEKECLGLFWDRYAASADDCQENCGFDVDCEVYNWFDDNQSCWRGSADDCTGSHTPSASAFKKLGQECWNSSPECAFDSGEICDACGSLGGTPMLCCREDWADNHPNCAGVEYSPFMAGHHHCVLEPESTSSSSSVTLEPTASPADSIRRFIRRNL